MEVVETVSEYLQIIYNTSYDTIVASFRYLDRSNKIHSWGFLFIGTSQNVYILQFHYALMAHAVLVWYPTLRQYVVVKFSIIFVRKDLLWGGFAQSVDPFSHNSSCFNGFQTLVFVSLVLINFQYSSYSGPLCWRSTILDSGNIQGSVRRICTIIVIGLNWLVFQMLKVVPLHSCTYTESELG